MFTGLVEEEGVIERTERKGGSVVFTIRAPETARGLKVDESIAVNGVCLTVIRSKGRVFSLQAVEETLRKTNLGGLKVGDRINLERALLPNERLGGHFVQGHVDGVGVVARISKRASSWMFWFKMPRRAMKYVIPVGSIAINGVSLTVAAVKDDVIGISIIPHTWNVTTFKDLKCGDRVNVEFDMLGKYVERLLRQRRK
jgi:riboflavin synthase